MIQSAVCFISANPLTQKVNLNSSFEGKQPTAIIIHSDENEKNKKPDLSRLDRNYSCLKREKFLAEHFSVHHSPIRWKLRFNSPRRSSTPQGSTAPEDNRKWLAAREGWSEVAMKSFSLMEFHVQRKLYTSLSIRVHNPKTRRLQLKVLQLNFHSSSDAIAIMTWNHFHAQARLFVIYFACDACMMETEQVAGEKSDSFHYGEHISTAELRCELT